MSSSDESRSADDRAAADVSPSDPPLRRPSARPDPQDSGTGNGGPASSSSSGSLVGHRLGDYQLMRKLGRGGMADVYAARHLTLGRDVAIKVLRNEYARDQDYVERFRREARAAAKLNHPCIVQVYDVGNVDSWHYIAQELIDGNNLREQVTRDGTLSAEEAVDVLLSVGAALEVAAEAGITHRDIKPENIMRSARGVVKVADFGLARLGPEPGTSHADLTQAGLTLGTPRYMSPEQVQGHAVDVRSDLYSLGVTMYFLLTGRPPFEADDPLALAVMHLHETPVPLDRARRADDLPPWLVAVVMRLMNKSPDNRFQSPTELLEAVRNEADAAGPVGGRIGSTSARIRLQRASDQARRRRRQRLLRITLAVLVPVLCATVAGAAALRRYDPDIARTLNPEQIVREETVEEQFLGAAVRQDPQGWRAVGEYFPPQENSLNADYHAKAMLQLAELYIREQRLAQADQVLNDLLEENVERLYRALALVKQHRVAGLQQDASRQRQLRERVQKLYADMKSNNPETIDLFHQVVHAEEQFNLGIQSAGREIAN